MAVFGAACFSMTVTIYNEMFCCPSLVGCAFRIVRNVDNFSCLLQEVLQKIKDTAKMTIDGERPQCYVLFVLTHGDENGLLGTDGEHFKRTEIYEALDNCSNLKKSVRIVFVQSCRGGRLKSLLFLLSHNHVVSLIYRKVVS